MANSRVTRGRQTEQLVADYLKDCFPHVERRPASLPGTDLINTPGWAFEIKARRGFDPGAWAKQALKNAIEQEDFPVVVMRPQGSGEKSMDEWPVFMTLADLRLLILAIQDSESVD